MSWKGIAAIAETPDSSHMANTTPSSSSSIKREVDEAFYEAVSQERHRFAQDMDKHIAQTYAANVEEEMSMVTRSADQEVGSVEETLRQCRFLQATELQKITAVLQEVTAMVGVNDDIRKQFVRLFEVHQEDFHRYEVERREKLRRDLEALYQEYDIADDGSFAHNASYEGTEDDG